jgi:hypothetical protein
MRRWLFLITVGIFLGIAVNCRADDGSIYYLSFRTLRMIPGERVSKFELHVHSAMIVGFRSIPVGWRINIDNDPSWSTEVSGIAVVGAADLEPSALRPWFLSLLPEPSDRSERMTEININGSVTLSNRDKTRVVEITNRDVTLQPSRP